MNSLERACLRVFALGVLLVVLGAFLRGSTERRKDILFVGPTPHCVGDAVECAESLHFNGDWTGTKLCRAAKCVRFEDIFMEKR